MRRIILYVIMLSISFGCKAQESIKARYVGHQYTGTKNESFVNDELIFVNGNDTVRLNVKLPFAKGKSQIINLGIFYNCHLRKDTVYVITLKRICINDMPESFSSYYKANAIPDAKDCSKFTEIENNTEYNYAGNYGKYVDMDNVLYEIVGLNPKNGCVFQH